MKISVIIPMFNAENTIVEALDSVVNQSFDGFYDVWIIDDGSSDNSVSVVHDYISKFNDQNFKFTLLSQKNQGVAKARNMALMRATGDWVAFLDADDAWHPRKIEIMSSFFSDTYSVIGHSSALKKAAVIIPSVDQIKIKEISYVSVLLKNCFVTPGVVIKNEKKLFNEKMRFTEDHEFWLRLLHRKKGLFVNVPLVHLNRPVLSKGGLSSSIWKMRKGEIFMYSNIYRYNKKAIFFVPFLVLFSLLKCVKLYFFNQAR
ncbi:MAG: glycosyltransferase [Bergeyella sp.]|nr:glycosyltransferase [Bergeyella sp.]